MKGDVEIGGASYLEVSELARVARQRDQLREALEDICDMWRTVCEASGWDANHMAQYEQARTALKQTENTNGRD